ncbi:MAG: hypothetical protein ACRD1V_17175, partial [Vicinamibacterales bacterium]
MRASAVLSIVLFTLQLQSLPTQQPPRDARSQPPPQPMGTAVIRGHVMASDSGNPILRAGVV